MMNVKKIKTIRGYTALARFLSILEEPKFGGDEYLEVKRSEVSEDLPTSPYAYSPDVSFSKTQDGKYITWIETAHLKYEIFEFIKEN